MEKVMFTDYQISGNLRRTARKGLLSTLNKKNLYYLTDKYFRDSQGILHCAYSGSPILTQDQLEMEHIIPVSRDGGTVLFNVVPCLSTYNGNGQKATNNLLDWWEDSRMLKIELLENLIRYMFEAHELSIEQQNDIENYSYESDEPYSPVSCSMQTFDEIRKTKEEKVKYDQFLYSCILKLKELGVDISEYIQRYNHLQEKEIFEELEQQRRIQTELFRIFKFYAPEYKYDIVTSIDYENLLEKYQGKKDSEIIAEIEKRINEIVIYCNQKKINQNEMLHAIIKYQDILWSTNYRIEELENITLKYLNGIVEELENFCKNFGWFPRKVVIIKGREKKDIKNYTTEELYETRLRSRYTNNLKKFLPSQKTKIKELKKQYSLQKIIDTNELFDEIVEFSNKYWFPRAVHKENITEQEQKEKLLYANYRNHLDKFTKIQLDAIKILQEERSYFKISLNDYYNSIVDFVKKNGHFPRITGSENETYLYNAYLRNRDSFTKEQLEHLEELKKDNSYFDFNALEVIKELTLFIKKYERFPVSEVRRNGIRIHAEDFTEEEKYEVNLYAKYRRSKNRIPKETIEKLENLREELVVKHLYEDIINFVEINGYFPRYIIKRRDGIKLKAEELTPEELAEKRLNANFAAYKRNGKFTSEQLVILLELQKNNQIYLFRANEMFTQLIEFITNNHRFPRIQIRKNNQILLAEQLSNEELMEVRLRYSYERLKDKLSIEQKKYLSKITEEIIINNESQTENRRKAS